MLQKSFLLSIVLLSLASFSISYPSYALLIHFFYDPITDSPCSLTNYWTPFNQETTCYRFTNFSPEDSEDKSTITLMLDHNVAQDTFDNAETILSNLKAKWTRFTGEMKIPTEEMLYNIMKYTSKPTTSAEVKPPVRLADYYMNCAYVVDGIKTSSAGYWTSTTYEEDEQYAYGIGGTGNNFLSKKTVKRGIRPIIIIEKSLLNVIPNDIDITKFVTSGKVYKYPFENTVYDGVVYKQMQGSIVTDDSIIWAASNSKNPDNCVLYRYSGENFADFERSLYDSCGHGNGITYNNKKDTILLVGPDSYKEVREYDAHSLELLTAYKTSDGYPAFSGIGYIYDRDLFLGKNSRYIYYCESTEKFKILNQFDFSMFETGQDIEYYDEYIFLPVYEGGLSTYEVYSFHEKGTNFVYVYDGKLDQNGKATQNFGRLISKVAIGKGYGELEGISFRNGKVYFDYATKSIDSTYAYTFYEQDYEEFKKIFLNYV